MKRLILLRRCALFVDYGVVPGVDSERSGYMKMLILLQRCALFEDSGVDSGEDSGWSGYMKMLILLSRCALFKIRCWFSLRSGSVSDSESAVWKCWFCDRGVQFLRFGAGSGWDPVLGQVFKTFDFALTACNFWDPDLFQVLVRVSENVVAAL